MKLTVVEENSALIHLALEGRLDIEGVPQVQNKFLAYVASRNTSAIIDISGVAFIASLGMGMFVDAAKALARRGAKLILLRPQPLVAGALKNARLDTIMSLTDDPAQANLLAGAAG